MFEAWHLWIIAGLLLSLLELIGGQFVFLAIGVSCLVGASFAGLTDQPFKWQLGVTVVAAAILIPLFVGLYRRYGMPAGRATTGEGAESTEQYHITEYNGRIGVKIKGDFFPVKEQAGSPLVVGEQVKVVKMDGITAIVYKVKA
jgi:membrane protein implicated in regulation of membrane protease activity|tara:strand:+ start:492 stop:923 length:432 start_codon:yes stop_codon:yes gene_type:complete